MLKGNNFWMSVKAGVAIKPQSIGAATVNGETILAPWKTGRQITFILQGGAFSSTSVGHCVLQVRNADATWEASDPALAFTTSKLADSGALEGSYLLATFDFSDVVGLERLHDAIRLSYTQDTSAQTQLISASYVISDLFKHPSTEATPEFWAQAMPADHPAITL